MPENFRLKKKYRSLRYVQPQHRFKVRSRPRCESRKIDCALLCFTNETRIVLLMSTRTYLEDINATVESLVNDERTI